MIFTSYWQMTNRLHPRRTADWMLKTRSLSGFWSSPGSSYTTKTVYPVERLVFPRSNQKSGFRSFRRQMSRIFNSTYNRWLADEHCKVGEMVALTACVGGVADHCGAPCCAPGLPIIVPESTARSLILKHALKQQN